MTLLIDSGMTIVLGQAAVRAPQVEGAKVAASAAGPVAVGTAVEAAPAVVEVAPAVAEVAPAAAEVAPVAAEVAPAAGVDPVVAVAGEAPRGRSRIGPAPTWAQGRSADRQTAIV